MTRRIIGFFLVVSIIHVQVVAQVLSNTPSYPTDEDSLTIIFDATQGNGELTGVAQVYAHTGAITNLSNASSNWRGKRGIWGEADSTVEMENIGNNKHQLKISCKRLLWHPGNRRDQGTSLCFQE